MRRPTTSEIRYEAARLVAEIVEIAGDVRRRIRCLSNRASQVRRDSRRLRKQTFYEAEVDVGIIVAWMWGLGIGSGLVLIVCIAAHVLPWLAGL